MKRLIVIVMFLLGFLSENSSYSQCGGFCGGFAGACWCDDFCWIAGDCCPDMCASCPGQGPNTIANCVPPPPPPPPPCGTPVVFNYSGGIQNFVVPAGVTSITIVAEGGQGGSVGGTSGGLGAAVTFTVPVVPGQVVSMDIGGAGGCPGAGYNGGGIGYNSSDGTAAWGSCGGGGATEVSIGGVLVAVAGGGGGAGGGSVTANTGGPGGCANGGAGTNTFGAGGGGGTQTTGGIGGAPWAGTPPGGQNGSLFQGGNGGLWQTASGGGGGGGYYGGGGGGNDGCCTGANGGGGGGGGSSLVPGGGGCTQGANAGNGSVTIYIPTPNTMTSPNTATICSGGTVNIPLTSTVAGSSFAWVATANGNVTGESTTLQTTSTLNNTLTNTAAGVQTVTYTVTPSTVGCPGTPQTVTVTVNPPPVITAEPDLTYCAGAAVPLNSFTSTPAGATFIWTNSNTAIGLGANGVGSVPGFTATNATAAPITGTISVTPTLGTCGGPVEVYTITVNPIPTVTDPANQSLCANAMTTAVNFTGTAGATFNWTNDNTSIGLAAAGTGNIASFQALNPNPGTTVTATITVTPVLNGCSGTSQTFTITVINTLPTLNCPGNLTAVCSIAEQPPYANYAAFTGAGGSASSVGGVIQAASFTLVSEVSNGLTCPETVTRTYSIADNCGNVATCQQTIVIDDNINPTASNPAPIAVQCLADVPASNPAVVIGEADNCSTPVVAFVSEVSAGTCPQTITRTYSVTDACGNSINVTHVITVDDTTNPTASNPAPIAVQCLADVPASNPAVVIDEADNCSVPVVAFVSDVSNGLSCPETITRTYSVTDACGNQILVTQTIVVDDTTNPTASNPATFNGSALPPVDITVVIDEADNCSVPVVAFVSDVSDGLTCPETITRTYSVTDACGNQILVTQTIIIGDPFPPTASNPAAVNVQCIADVPAPDPLVVIDEADNNGVPVVAFVSDVSDGNTCPETITRTYSVTDACGNQILLTQTIVVDDTTNPTASNPAPVTVQCIADVPASDPTVITDEADNCSVPTVLFVSDASDGNTCPETITRTYSVTDACGNQILVTQTIVVDDTTNPTASNPAPVTVQCIADVPASDPTVVTDEADNCSVPTVLFVSDASDGNTCPETITRTYSVTDACGNQILVTQTITVDDTTDPTASNPATFNGSTVPPVDITVVIDEADNCSVPTVAFVSDVSDGLTCPETITRTYSVTDACGNQILVTQAIIIGDPFPPTASNPVGVNVQCIADVPAPDPLVVTDEADNNGVPVVAFVSDVSDGNTCPETITRTYSVTDACINQILVTQIIVVDDTTNPTASNPAPVAVQCIADVPASDPTVVTDEADNCTVNPTVLHVSDVSDGLTCPETITRTYSVTDDCGNQILVTQTITVDDTTNPTASNPAPVTVQCIADVPASDPTVVTDEADNCSVPTVLFVSDVSDGNTCPETITRTYSVTDACGNTINVTQTITVDDTTDPTASNPATVIVPGGPAPAPDPTVVIDEADNCSVPTVLFVSDVSDGNLCPETITRTYSVTDACGNQILVTQTIQITDPILPTASNPAAVNVQCIADVPAADPLVVTDEADNNGVPVVAFVSDVSDGNTCPETITRTYSVTDVCSNQIFVTQIITVNDNINPTGTAPANIAVQCIGDVPAANITLITDEADNCSTPTVAFIGDASNGGSCPEIITRTYRITDACGNFIDVTQTITVDDTTNPTASNPAPVTVQCAADIPGANPAVVTDEGDNCSVPVVGFVGDVSDGNTCPETITRTYSVTDACGNQILVTQTIIVDDTTNPTASNPAPINVTCASAVPAPDPSVVTDEADNCSAPVVAFVSEVSDGNVCNNETLTRTYSVTDNCGNSITVMQQIIIGVTTPIVDAGADQAVCEGTSVTLTAGNPNGAAISWDNAINGTPFTAPLGTTVYTVTASQCGGECVATDQVNVTVNPMPVVLFDANEFSGCAPFTTTFHNLSSPAGNNCVWNFGSGSTVGCDSVTHTFMNAGTYDVSLTVTTLEGCTSSATYNSYINVSPYPEAAFSFSPNEVFVNNPEVQFTNSSSNADSYLWTFGDGIESLQENPTHIFPETGNVTYEVELVAYSNAGCADSVTVQVTIQDVLIFYVPNVFTPDGDGNNNTFLPVFTSGFDIYDYHLTIFNRWGEVVFESYNSTVGWTGTYADQGLVDDGVYIWQVEFGDNTSDKRQKHRGHVTVLK